MKIRLSGIIIAKNEEDRIADCLESLSFCNEVILIDGGSTDKTVEIAKRMHAVVSQYQTSNYAKMREIGMEKAKGEWIFYLDADERVTESLKKELTDYFLEEKVIQSDYVAFKIPRENYYFGNYRWPAVEKLERVFKKSTLKGWRGELHESPIVEGAIGQLQSPIVHFSHRDLFSMVEKTNEWSEIEAKLRFKSQHPKMTWWRFPRVMMTAFFNSYILQGGWKIGTVGIMESIYQAFSTFITYAKLWELQKK